MPLQTRELILTGAVVFLFSYVILGVWNPPIVQSKKDDCKCAANTFKTIMWSAVPVVMWMIIYEYIYRRFEKQV